MARPWGVGVVALLVMGPLVLGGCSDTKQAGSTLPSTTKAAATSTSSLPPLGPADFPVPPAARQKTPDGVIAFTKYYVALMNHQAEALDSTPLRDLSRECQACKELADSYDQVKAAGQRSFI